MIQSVPSESFRDTLSNSTQDGGRKWLYPEIVKGKWFFRRAWVAYILLACLLTGPFLEWNGHPIFLFNVLERQFILFGVGFGPQDMNLLVLGVLTFAVFIFAFTNAFGRLWCGWACPQTIFMEWIFRPLESFIEGNANARRKADQEPGSTQKVLKKTLKYLLFWIISFGIANVFLTYIIGKKEWLSIVTDNPADHATGLAAILIFTGVFFFVFTRLREIVCITICPYGRLQGTLQDANSLVVSYDIVRGEPRSHKKEASGAAAGDCVDCNWCVKVCPTGIDIRNGLQMECIQCTACMDACDMVMEKVKRPTELVGYFSENQLKNKSKFKLKTKSLAYFGLWALLFTLFASLLIRRPDIEAQIIRTPGKTEITLDANTKANLYNFELSNKTFLHQDVEFKPETQGFELNMIGQSRIQVEPVSIAKGSFMLATQGQSTFNPSQEVYIQLVNKEGKVIDRIKTRFFQSSAKN